MGIMDLKIAPVAACVIKPTDTLIIAGKPQTVTRVKTRWVRPRAGKLPVIRVMIHAGGFVIHTNPDTQLIKRY